MLRIWICLCVALCAATASANATSTEDSSKEPADAEETPAEGPAPLCLNDKRLKEVATRLAEDQDIPASPELVRAVRKAGVSANPVYAKFGITGETETFRSWLIDLKEKSDGPMVCGRGRSGERVVLIAAVQAGSLEMVNPQTVRAELIDTFRSPYLVVRHDRSEARRVAVDDQGPGSEVSLPAEWGRPLFMQLVATGPNGPRPIAERWVGTIPRSEPSRGSSQSPASWLLQLRRASGARSLRDNRLLAKEATIHAQAVCESGRIGHELDPYGDPEARLLSRGVEARVVGEAVARAKTLPEALHGIEDSPSHRLTVTDERFTDVGYGVAKDDRDRTCVVVLLASWPRKVP